MTKREICERLLEILCPVTDTTKEFIRTLLLDLAAPETANPFKGMSVADLAANAEWLCTPYINPENEEPEKKEPKSKFPIGHPLHMSTEEMKAADTALFIQTGGRMGKDWRNAEKRGEGEK